MFCCVLVEEVLYLPKVINCYRYGSIMQCCVAFDCTNSTVVTASVYVNVLDDTSDRCIDKLIAYSGL